eukprot:CAMPEP_0194051258 /NCGR_PEP_ID=MMETSP0009_2-20130614/39468_1 /TAXON_ID=210454 /ORGANISM="Grammatophora oceanica, Strain CCMP 410" /LENGTH=42 /DNA_ID= /DNA_START= /DNA_END= /DNA_ORIENTATION=
MTDISWSESNMTYNTRPTSGTTVIAEYYSDNTEYHWIQIDLT